MALFNSGAAPHWMIHQVSMTMPPPPQDPEALLFDRIGYLGEGGFAGVSKVRHRRTGAVFALKETFNPSPDAEHEVEVIRRIKFFNSSSPFVVRCHGVVVGSDGVQRSFHEFMDAGSLLHILYRRGNRGFPETVLAEVANRCLMGLLTLHCCGVAHLDVKPENFLANSLGDVKINDFNLSRIVNWSPRVPTNMGTLSYFSPERFRAKTLDPRDAMAADVWALGLTILELFTGRSAITTEAKEPDAMDCMEAICNREPPSVPDNVEASPELRDFVSLCLQKDPARRAKVSQLLNHPFVKRRTIYMLNEFIRENMQCRSRDA